MPSRRTNRIDLLHGAATGIASGVAGLGVAELVAGTSRNLRSPVLSVGDRAIDLVPPALKRLAIEWFGTNDKLALLVGIGVVVTASAAALGILAVRRGVGPGLLGVAGFGAVGAAAALGDRTGTRLAAAGPSIAGSIATAAALWWLARSARVPTGSPNPSPPGSGSPVTVRSGVPLGIADLVPNGRRRFLGAAAVLTGFGAIAGTIGRRLDARFGAAESRAAVRVPVPATAAPPIPARATLPTAGIAPFFTPNRDFYRIDTALTVPQVPAETWRLDIGGMVDHPLTIGYDELVARPLHEADITLVCVSNLVGGGLVGTARWVGVRLDDLLAEAGIDPAADQIVGRSIDGYTCGFPVAALDGRDALIAVSMNGEPLPLEHGFPARLIVPGLYGYVSATKWLTEIELTTFDAFDSYWVPRGYAARAPIRAQSRIDTPRTLTTVQPGPVPLGGVAWAQPIGVRAVQLRIDDSPWMDAELGAEVSGDTWRQWQYVWDATPGRHSITVRLIDNNGVAQDPVRRDPLPDGAAGLHTVVLTVADA